MYKNNKKIIVVSIILIIFVLLGSPFIIWQAKTSKNLNVLIIDKTVPDATYREHKGFMWILNNLKIQNEGKPFSYDEDYYGFFPLSNEKYVIKELPESLRPPDLIYLADTYGVYLQDFYKKNLQDNQSSLIYGGTKEKEINIIKNLLNKNVIIGEFNTLASPTEANANEQLEQIFGLKWSGWIGRYFSDLSKSNIEIPVWIQEAYAMQHGVKWDFKGAGIVLVSSSDRIIVLRDGVELGKNLNRIRFTKTAENDLHVKNNVKYYYWFEICEPLKDAKILASYQIDLTKEGKKTMDRYNLPNEFPAVVMKNEDFTSYYFAGDFADCNTTPNIYYASGLQFLNKITTFDEDTNQNYFYWNVYYPLIETIVENIE